MDSRWRTIRVFLSSTFRDMHSERDYLVKVVFPSLRERLEPYRVQLIDIDLRWGITAEEAENDRVLGLCLELIDQCRPYFIGLLGERYGWVPSSLGDVKSKHDWVPGHAGASVTELEILHGVLRSPAMQPRALFFFRDPSFIDDVPADRKPDLLAESPEGERRLQRLKQTIRDARLPFPPIENYACRYMGLRINWRLARQELGPTDQQYLESICRDGLVDNVEYANLPGRLRDVVNRHSVIYLAGLEAFGKLVLDRLWAAISAELELPDVAHAPSIESETRSLTEEQEFHARFMDARLRVYVGREKFYEQALGFAEDNSEEICLVTGPPGSGKSAALANLARSIVRTHPDWNVITHFVGAGPRSVRLHEMLRRFCLELKERYPTALEIPAQTGQLATTFRSILATIPASERLVLIIDGLNQLDDFDAACDLHWLPEEPPPNCKVLIGCLLDESAHHVLRKELARRRHTRIDLEPLSFGERMAIARQIPSLSAKTLDEHQLRLLLENSASANPLYLTVALEELRGFGSFEQLTSYIQDLPRGDNAVLDLFNLMIERLEQDFGAELVGDLLKLLACARRGLSVRELTQLTAEGSNAADLHAALRQLRPYLLQRGDRLDFFHASLREAVRTRYLKTESDVRLQHRWLASYFEQHHDPFRRLEELPWQLIQADQLDRLQALASERDFVQLAWSRQPDELKSYWTHLEANSSHRLSETFHPLAATRLTNVRDATFAADVAKLLFETGNTEVSLAIHEQLVAFHRTYKSDVGLADALEGLARNLTTRAALESAMGVAREFEAHCRTRNDRRGIARALSIQAHNLATRDHHEPALALHRDADALFRELQDERELQNCLHQQGHLLLILGRKDEAEQMFRDQEAMCRRLGIPNGIGESLGGQAAVHIARNELDQALPLLQEEEALLRKLGNKDALVTCLGLRQAAILRRKGDLSRAGALLDEAEMLVQELGSGPGFLNVLAERAELFEQLDDKQAAAAAWERALEIAQQMGAASPASRTAGILQKLFGIYQSLGDATKGLQLYERSSVIIEGLPPSKGTAAMMGNLGLLLKDANRPDLAGPVFRRAAALQQSQWSNHDLAAKCLVFALEATLKSDRVDEAQAIAEQVSPLIHEMNDPKTTQFFLPHLRALASALRKHDRLEDSVDASQDHIRLTRTLGNQGALAGALIEHGQCLLEARRIEESVATFREAEKLCRANGDLGTASMVLIFCAGAFFRNGRFAEAYEPARESYATSRAAGPGGNHRGCLFGGISQFALHLNAAGKADEALAILGEGAQWMSDLNEPAHHSWLVFKQAEIHQARKRFDEAGKKFSEVLRILDSAGDGLEPKLRVVSTYGLAQSLRSTNQFGQAIAHYRLHDQLCRAQGLLDRIPISLSDQAVVLMQLGRSAEALSAAQEMEKLSVTQGNVQNQLLALQMQISVLVSLRRNGEAADLLTRAQVLAKSAGQSALSSQLDSLGKKLRLLH